MLFGFSPDASHKIAKKFGEAPGLNLNFLQSYAQFAKPFIILNPQEILAEA